MAAIHDLLAQVQDQALRERIEKQIKTDNPQPKTNEFMVMVRYNQMIDDLVHELLLKEMEF